MGVRGLLRLLLLVAALCSVAHMHAAVADEGAAAVDASSADIGYVVR